MLGVVIRPRQHDLLAGIHAGMDDQRREQVARHPAVIFGHGHDDADLKRLLSAQADGALPKTYEAYTRWDDFRAYRPENVLDVPSLLVGDPKVLIDKIEAQRALGIDNFILWMNRGGGIDQRDVLHAMDLFANEVMPNFAKVPAR